MLLEVVRGVLKDDIEWQRSSKDCLKIKRICYSASVMSDCHSLPFCDQQAFSAILSHSMSWHAHILAEISQIFAKNGFGKGFALQKAKTKIDKNNKTINK